MSEIGSDRAFGRAVSEIYARYLVPLIFEPYADALAERVVSRAPARVLETAAGTGVLTRVLSSRLPADASIVATDLNQAMLDEATRAGTHRPVLWRQADALQLPFAEATFDAVVCQFGVMFFPDKGRAFAEARRVLRPGGILLFSVWDSIRENEFAETVERAVATLWPADPPRFLSRTPHGYFDRTAIERDLERGGFVGARRFETVAARSRADSYLEPALAYCHGTPLRHEIEARGPSALREATSAASDAIGRRFGRGTIDGKIQATIVAVER